MRRLRVILSFVLAASLPLQALAAVSVRAPAAAKTCHGMAAVKAPAAKSDCCKGQQHGCQKGQCCAGVAAYSAPFAAAGFAGTGESPLQAFAGTRLASHCLPLYRPPIALLS